MIGMYSAAKAVLVFCLFVSTLTRAATMEPIPASAYEQSQERILIAPGLHINLYCLGKGEPTVLFDSGLGDGTLSWRLVQGETAKTTRACSFDRANYFFSDSVDGRATAQAMADDMLALITKAQLGDQIIFVGHSRGGLNVRLFAYEHTNRVAGLVLVDPTVTEKLSLAMTSNYVHKYENYLARGQQLQNCQHSAILGILRAGGADPLHCLDDFGVQHDPREQTLSRDIGSMESRPRFQAALFSERQNLFYPIDSAGESTDGLSISRAEHSLGDIPLVVISADWFKSASFKGKPTFEQMQFLAWNTDQMRRISLESTQGILVKVASQHYVQKEHPDLVVDAIRHVIDLARSPASH